MVKILFTVLLFCLIGQGASGQVKNPNDSLFTGIVSEFKDAGKGSLYSLSVINTTSNDTLISLIQFELVKDYTKNLIGKKVTLSYSLQIDNYLQFVELDSGQRKPTESSNRQFRSVVGRLQTCTCGDMDGFMDIELLDGELMAFKTDYYTPEDVYRGDDILVHYAVREEARVRTFVLLNP